MKIFLSHSSTDKTIVRKIYEELGASLCHFDQATFEPTGSIPEEIFKALNESTHFVLFASPAAINSPWVQGELSRAFESWMRAGVRDAMVFLLGGADVKDLPSWLQRYVMREPPSYRHILCRIQSEIDKEIHLQKSPPFYRSDELRKMENMLLVETKSMPGVLMLHGPDGSGRKELINELYARQFPFVARRKILIAASTFITEQELYRDVVGLMTIATPSEFSEIFRDFEALDYNERLAKLAFKIEECAQGGQVLLLEGEHALFTEDGRLPDWFVDLTLLLSGKDYPKLAVTGYRRPLNLPVKAFDKLLIQEVPALDKDNSRILFNWWLKHLQTPFTESLKDVVFEACTGSPKQLELGAKLLVAEGAGNVSKIKPYLLKTLEGLSKQFLSTLTSSPLNATILAFVANAGYITRSDLTQYVIDLRIADVDSINDSIALCSSYGFLVEDEVCLRMPNYLVRGARAIGRDGSTADNLKRLFERQGALAGSLAVDELTSVPILNEYCLSLLRTGQNAGIFESIILPSQCVQVARSMYENEDYDQTLLLCERAYESRAALSKDGLIEALRYMGMAAARLANEIYFAAAIQRFEDVLDSIKAVRIQNFLRGFRKRLDGRFDESLVFLNAAYKAKGETDIHILRELASLTLNLGDVSAARKFIGFAMSRVSSNQYVIEMAIRVELVTSPAEVAKRGAEIERLLESLYAFDRSLDKIYWMNSKCEYLLALNEVDKAEHFLNEHAKHVKVTMVEALRARILMKRGSFAKAQLILQELYKKTLELRTGQRQSTLPLICKILVEAATANSLVEGVEWFATCRRYLPERIARKLASSILETMAHAQGKLSPAQLTMLRQATA